MSQWVDNNGRCRSFIIQFINSLFPVGLRQEADGDAAVSTVIHFRHIDEIRHVMNCLTDNISLLDDLKHIRPVPKYLIREASYSDFALCISDFVLYVQL